MEKPERSEVSTSIAMGRGRVAVVDDVAELQTERSVVRIEGDRVHKMRGPRYRAMARRELAALKRLQGLEGFPVLVECSGDGLHMTTLRMPGTVLHDCAQIPDQAFVHLRALVEAMLERGVARHSLPSRDVLVGEDGRCSLLDFERTRLRRFRFGPLWLFERALTRYHLVRLIAEHAPHLLTPREAARFRRRFALRRLHYRFRVWNKRWRERLRLAFRGER
jgi:hypothetical protein